MNLAEATPVLSERDLLAATRPYTVESKWKSWWHVGSTLGVITGVLTLAAIAPWWWLQLLASLLGALVMVRGFILFHDFAHGAILRKSKFARVILSLYSMIFLAGVSYWREAHNFHHAHVSEVDKSSQGSFPIMTLEQWKTASPMQRLYYRVNRNPLTMVLAYVTVFLFSNTLEPFFRNPIKHWTSGVSVLVHAGLIALLWWVGGPWTAFFAFWLPYSIAAMLGAYLFYAQHNFPEMEVLPPGEWTRAEASLRSTSFMRLNRFLDWCTGSIGYHHVHHLNSTIPFYRLREAMEGIPQLQHAHVTTLRPTDIWRCMRLKLWDEVDRRMLSWREARAAMRLRAST
ncbi:MAG: fatty acid desaturase [Planctomycetes bacterium]|nr:fatty acid desaturase [Planctomycetota bacterium]